MNRRNAFIKNILWELGYYLIVIVLGFLAPRLIILVYGSEVNGLSTTITQIISVILLLQSGATTAAVFSLYQPIAENDNEQVSAKVSATSRYFMRLSFVFLGVMILVAFVMSETIQSSIDRKMIFIAFLFMGLKSFCDLFFTSKYRVVFTAYEQKYFVSIGTLIEQVVYYVLVFGTIYARAHYIYIYIWFLLGCLVKIVYLGCIYRRKHRTIVKRSDIKGKVVTGTGYALANEVSHSVVSSSITILLSFMHGLEETSVYSVYALVSSALSLITTAVYSAFAPSFGNIVAEHDNQKARNVFRIFELIYISFNAVLMMCMCYLLVPFVEIYTKGATDAEYVNTGLACLLALFGLVSAFRVPYNIIVSSYGFFRQTWKQPVVFAFISLVASYFMGQMSYELIMIGPIVFYLANYLYQHFRLKKLVPYLISSKTFVLSFMGIIGVAIAMISFSIVPVPAKVGWWIFAAILSFLISGIYVIIYIRIFANELWILLISYIKELFRRRC